jgi:hypothetical protein
MFSSLSTSASWQFYDNAFLPAPHGDRAARLGFELSATETDEFGTVLGTAQGPMIQYD